MAKATAKDKARAKTSPKVPPKVPPKAGAARRPKGRGGADLAAVFNGAPHALALFDAEDRLMYGNPAVLNIYRSLAFETQPYGRTYETILRHLVENGEFAGERVLHDPDAWIAWRLDHHRTGGEPVEERLTDGRWFEVSETRLPDGGCLAMWRDVTHERRAQLAIQDGIEGMAEGLAVWDQSGRLMFYNQRFADWFAGHDAPVQVGQSLRQTLENLCESGRVAIDQTPRSWVAQRLSARARAADQYAIAFTDDRHLLVRERRTRSGGYATVLLDVTDLRRHERELAARGAVLEQANVELELNRTAMENQAVILAAMAEELAVERDRANQALAEAEQAGEQLRTLAFTDSLTGALNRRAFFDAAEREVLRANRYGHPLSVLVVDLDHFKQINDRHGHAAGDMVLRCFVDIGRQVLRECDVLGRLGGEEFAIILPETGAVAAALAAERLRTALTRGMVTADGEAVAVTASIGLTQQAVGRESFETALARADGALYRAKATGRNRIWVQETPG